MFKFEVGMKVICCRVESMRPNERRYSGRYPRKGWIGTLLGWTNREDNEWDIDWQTSIFDDIPREVTEQGRNYIREWYIAPFCEKHKFSVGDEVVYSSGLHGDSLSNPLYNGRYEYTRGIVKRVSNEDDQITVGWAHKDHDIIRNTYREIDLLLASQLGKQPKKNIKKEIENLCSYLYSDNSNHDMFRDFPRIRQTGSGGSSSCSSSGVRRRN